MHSDSHYTIGNAHQVCQDYARSGCSPDGTIFTIVSDGCSSSKDTDIGSRLLTHQAELLLRGGPEALKQGLIDGHLIQGARERLPFLPEECLDATLLYAVTTPDGVTVRVAGDGVVVGLLNSGGFRYWDIDFHGAPAYPSYQLDPSRWALFQAAGFDARTVNEWHNGVCLTTITKVLIDDLTFSLDFTKDEYKAVFIVSDGAKSFTQDTGLNRVQVPLTEVIPEIVGVKSLAGSFIARRLIALQNKVCPSKKWRHEDDLAVGSIWMEYL